MGAEVFPRLQLQQQQAFNANASGLRSMVLKVASIDLTGRCMSVPTASMAVRWARIELRRSTEYARLFLCAIPANPMTSSPAPTATFRRAGPCRAQFSAAAMAEPVVVAHAILVGQEGRLCPSRFAY
jgi:hypothetical protein